jgi:hypothetical protein
MDFVDFMDEVDALGEKHGSTEKTLSRRCTQRDADFKESTAKA